MPEETHESGGCCCSSCPDDDDGEYFSVGFFFEAISVGYFIDDDLPLVVVVALSWILGVALFVSWDLVPDNRLLVGSATTAVGGAEVVAVAGAIKDADGAIVASNVAVGDTNASAPCSDVLLK